jgi:hypothetical protein
MKFNILYIFIFVFFTLVLFCILGNSTTREGLTNGPTETNKNLETTENTENTFNTVGLAKPASTATTTTYDNYNHYNGDSLPTTFYGPDGGKITINKLTKTMYVTDSSGKTTRYIKPQNNNMNSQGDASLYNSIFTGEDGSSSNIERSTNGQYVVNVKDNFGNRKTYSPNYNIDLNQSNEDQPLSETDISSGKYSGYNNNTESNSPTTGSTDDYINSLPKGIPANNIPPGQEHLYILKSQIVPPVCPVCPSNIVYRDKECSPCPACARCPEPSFECKKVPNYNAQNQNNDYLPVPVLSNFSGFGM